MNRKLEDSRSSLSKQRTNLSLYTRTTNRSDTFMSEDLDRIDGLSISVFTREKTDVLSDLGENDPKPTVIIETPRKIIPAPKRNHKEFLNMGYEQTRDSGVYKRTRRLFRIPQPRGLPKWPASFELSGTKLCDIEKESFEETEPMENGDAENGLPPLVANFGRASTYPSRMRVSPFFSSDYGMRRQRTDTFSGYGKRGSVKDNMELEKDLEEKVRRHVYACQVLGNARRGSPAVQSFTALREAMSPRRRKQLPMLDEGNISPRGLVRMGTTFLTDKGSIEFKENKRQPLALVIRTRDNERKPRLTREFSLDALPEISGRTLVAGSGFDI